MNEVELASLKGMSWEGSFRQKIYYKSVEIINKKYWEGGEYTNDNLAILRDCWECSKHGNLLCDALVEAEIEQQEVQYIVSLPGFLNTHELWHTRRVRNRKVLAYRGCGSDEVEAAAKGEVASLGASWTLSLDIAHFFAGRLVKGKGDKVVVSAWIDVDAWLNTGEHELVSAYVEQRGIIDVSQYDQNIINIDWEQRPRIRPYMQTQQLRN